MPGGDGTGPDNRGPMTGRAAGYCAGSDTPGFANPYGYGGRGMGRRGGFGWGGGFGKRGGFGQRNMYYVPGPAVPTGPETQYASPNVPSVAPSGASEQELQALREQAEYLKNALEDVSARLEALGNE